MSDFTKANLNYATEYQSALEQAFPYALYFGKLYSTPNNGRFRWVNSKTIEIPSIETSGRVMADRDTVAFAARNYNNYWETKTLTNQRKWSTLIHPKDIDQTNMVTTIANITQVFNEEQKFPEMDAYTISGLYSAWTTTIAGDGAHKEYTGKTADTFTLGSDLAEAGTAILKEFDTMMTRMDNARVPATGRVLYVTNEVKMALKYANLLDRTFDVQTTANGVNRAVESLDGVEIIAVPETLMKTVYDFSTGWKEGSGASTIGMFLVHPLAVITPVSYSFSKLDAPSALSEGKYTYYEESFEDVFILNNKADALQFAILG